MTNYQISSNLIAQTGNTEVAIKNATWQNIEKAVADIRRTMTQKYQIEFK